MYYTSEQLITRAEQCEGFVKIPSNYWIACVRRNQDDQKPNEFNDTFYLMKGNNIVKETTCTTTAGLPALQGGFKKYNSKGAAVVCSNIWMNDCFSYGLHAGKMPALRQVKEIYTTRDGNGNSIAEEYGERYKGMWYTNIHAATYNKHDKLLRKLIGNWSYGCIVLNYRPDYNEIIELTREQKSVSVIILKEFSI